MGFLSQRAQVNVVLFSAFAFAAVFATPFFFIFIAFAAAIGLGMYLFNRVFG